MNKVIEKIKKSSLLECGDRILVGLSGGADSMCLTHALNIIGKEMGFEVFTAHMNHNIRGEEAANDEKAAAEFAASLGIKHFSRSERVIEYAEKNSISEELAGRELRYAFFAELQKKYGFNKVATAHNKNDNAETILMNFMRGSGVSGLCGIPRRRGDIIRPLLDADRVEIEEYCRENKLPYVTDKTNFEHIYTRNKVRLELIPAIVSGFNANFINTVTRNADIISDDCDFLDEHAMMIYKNSVQNNIISADIIASAHPSMSRRVIMEMLANVMENLYDISSDCIQKIVDLCVCGKTGKSLNLPDNVIAKIEYGKLIISKQNEALGEFEYILLEGKEIYISELGKTFLMERTDMRKNDGAIYLPGGKDIRIRNRRAGDVFYPIGMKGKKKLKEFFIDEKIPRDERMRTGIVTSDGEIACIIGKRADRRFYVSKLNKPKIKIIIK